MHLLLTGAAGFIGSRVAESLLAEGHRVVGIDVLDAAYDVRLKQHRLDGLLRDPGFDFHRIDIIDRDALERACGGCPRFDGVIHLASRGAPRSSVLDPWASLDTNVAGALNLLELCHWRGVEKFILASTFGVYGTGGPLPFTEDQHTSRPLSPYAAFRKAAEMLAHSYHHLHDLDVTVLRYSSVYGPAGRPDTSIFRFCRWIVEGDPVEILGDGRQAYDFTYVDDIARGTILGLRPLGYEIVNLGSGEPHDLLRTVELIEQETGNKAHIEFGPPDAADVPAGWANVEKARRLLGWAPRVSLEEGIRRCVAWYVENRELAVQLML